MSEHHDCFELIDEALKENGVSLSMAIRFNPKTGNVISTPIVAVYTLDSATPKQKKAARTMNMLATNCPFCGVLLPREP